MSDELYATCPTCAALRLVEVPPCADGHGADCPDACCVECGTALFLDPVLLGAGARSSTLVPCAA